MSDNPYSDLPERAFWRPSISARNPLSLVDLYEKKFELTQSDRIVTAGSCFAQHIARKLKASGFTFCDYEPAPPLLPAHLHGAFNYGVYSARYCNIYTVRQLLQTFDRAYGHFTPQEPAWSKEGGVVDPFRPALEPEPFKDVDELEVARESHLKSVRDVFEKSDLFVFTMGLTEGWVSRSDGAVFPLCPGTAAGSFDSDAYQFVNFTYPEIHADLMAFIERLRGVNPGVRLLLTVSPVPLVATMSGDHVLSATSYSKSVLRAVAGQVSKELDFVDYFPSYEIIAAAPMRGMFFEPNMREVNPAGVDYVMSHFFRQHAPQAGAPAPAPAAEAPPAAAQSDIEIICEEMMLDTDK